MKGLEQTNLQKEKADQWLPGPGVGLTAMSMSKLWEETFRTLENVLHWIVVIPAKLYTFTKKKKITELHTNM